MHARRLAALARRVVRAAPSRPAPRAWSALPRDAGTPPTPAAALPKPEAALASVPAGDLLRGWAVLSACRSRRLVAHAGTLLKVALAVPPARALVRATFFSQFCAGETRADAAAAAARLAARGVGSIFDYAAEPDDSEGSDTPAATTTALPSSPPPAAAVARTHAYTDEATCDAAAAVFEEAIDAAAGCGTGRGFAAVKVTALGDPRLLAKLSSSVRALEALFSRFDADGDGAVSRREFDAAYKTIFVDASPPRLDTLWRHLAGSSDAPSIDKDAWRARVGLAQLPAIAPRARASDPLARAAPTAADLASLEALLARLRRLADRAASRGVRLLIDAEHSAVQPAVAHAARALQRALNRPGAPPAVFTTYQCYLIGAETAVRDDIAAARREGWTWAAKARRETGGGAARGPVSSRRRLPPSPPSQLVRGAYLRSERARAAAAGAPSPCHATLEATHACYAAAAATAIAAATDGSGHEEVMLATHNAASVAAAAASLSGGNGGSIKTDRVSFAQLYGMADTLTFGLAARGLPVYKYLPYGPMEQGVARRRGVWGLVG